MTIMSIYSPCDKTATARTEDFFKKMDAEVGEAKSKGDMLIVGGDWNAQIRKEDAPEAVGGWACNTSDGPGKRFGRFLQQHSLYLPTSWCQTQWRD